MDKFVKKNKQHLVKVNAHQVAPNRLVGASPEMINMYVDHLETLFKKHNYGEDCVINFDETPIVFEKKPRKVIISQKEKRVGVIPGLHDRYRFTLGICVCGDGSLFEPLVILRGKNLPDLPPYLLNWGMFRAQPNAWIDSVIFEDYCHHVVIPWAREKSEETERREGTKGTEKKQRFLFLLDRHSSRNNEVLLRELEEEGVDVVFFPPHTSHVTQPLDVGIFGGFKSMIHRKLRRRIRAEDDLPKRRLTMLETAFECIESTANRWAVRKAFTLSGICPLDRDMLLSNPLVGTCPIGLEQKQTERLEAYTVTGHHLIECLEKKRIEKEEKENKKKTKRVEGNLDTFRESKKRRVQSSRTRKKKSKLDWTQIATSDSEFSEESEKASEEE